MILATAATRETSGIVTPTTRRSVRGALSLLGCGIPCSSTPSVTQSGDEWFAHSGIEQACSLHRKRSKHRIQPFGRAMDYAPRPNRAEIDPLKPLNSQHIPGVVEILGPTPAEFLHDEILGQRKPCRPSETRQNEPPSTVELMLYERIVEQREEFDEEGRIGPCRSDMPTAPGQRVELHLWIEGDQRCKRRAQRRQVVQRSSGNRLAVGSGANRRHDFPYPRPAEPLQPPANLLPAKRRICRIQLGQGPLVHPDESAVGEGECFGQSLILRQPPGPDDPRPEKLTLESRQIGSRRIRIYLSLPHEVILKRKSVGLQTEAR